MLEVMYGSILVFLILNTFSFYILDYVTDRMTEQSSAGMTPSELGVYSVVRILVKVTALIVAISIVVNIFSGIIRLLSNS